MDLTTVPAGLRDRFADEWLAYTIGTYPEQTRRLLREDRDAFRNPVGHTLAVSLRGLAQELFGGFDRARVTAWLDAVVHLCAVQDGASADAVGFVALARHAVERVSEEGGPALGAGARELLGGRIDDMASIAAGLHHRCRDEIHAIGARAALRRDAVRARAHARAEARAAARGGAPQSAPRGELP